MKTTSSNPRIVQVATNIASTQSRRLTIDKRLDVLTAELTKLNAERDNLGTVQSQLQREMDKLTGNQHLTA